MTSDKKIILHLGASKCATTTFQGFLHDRDAALRAQGVLWPKSMRIRYNDGALGAVMGLPKHINHYRIRHNLDLFSEKDVQGHIESALLREVEENPCNTVIFSFEGLLPRNEEQIDHLLTLLRKIGPNISTVTALRRHDSWAVSSYNTRLIGHGTTVKNMLLKDPVPGRPEPRPHGIPYFKQLKQWENAVGKENMSVFAFEDFENALEGYAKNIGFKFDDVSAPVLNKGMSAYSQEIVRRYNEIVAEEHATTLGDPKAEYSAKIIRRALKALLPRGASKKPSMAQVQRHRAHFAEDVDALRGTYLDAESKFFDDTNAFPDTRTHVHVDDADVMEWAAKAKELELEAKESDALMNGDSEGYWQLVELVALGPDARQA